MEAPQSLSREKKHWWMMNRKIVNKHIRDARSLIATQDPNGVSAAIGILDCALALSPRLEVALELKARSLLFLRRFRDVADMLQDYIPSYRGGSGAPAAPAAAFDDSSTSLSSTGSGSGRAVSDSREGAQLLPKCENGGDRGLRCFSIYDIKRKLVAGIHRAAGDREGQWRYLILGQACCHLGLLEDAMILLQTGRRLASAAFRRESITHSDDIFNFSPTIPSFPPTNSKSNLNAITSPQNPPTNPISESESASNLLTHIKLLLRRRSAAISSLDAGHPIEAARHFSKILENRRGTPHPFAATCLIGRAAAYRDAGRIAEAIADCNRALAIDPTSIPALRTRADLLESVRCLTDCLRDLDNLKLLYDTIFRDRKLPGPVWRRPFDDEIRYRDIPNSLRSLTARINGIRQRFAAGEGNDVDYYKLIGVRRGCSRSELERANLLLLLRHKPDKAGAFVDKLEFSDEYWDLDAVRDQARMSALILYRMLQKGYSCIMATIMEEEVERKRAAVAAEKQAQLAPAVYQGVFCRDMATVGSMLSRVIPVKYEGLSC
ncbi:LOW QUALITY PROTEIN: uncharacterized protein LOC110031006 [Phalaenopsis equestris]|uniref:LOW QUALITY PROTEIN: uncharacterized protein LOC110031006 n=1 Tax=Phalaenopsis equestris TaxID=78828 RepID=UPI0009E5D5A5|nr:LOW QUALITY PROTEIN: uncharacterized protein LOC110031006 [Phalaenopsis equestris]